MAGEGAAMLNLKEDRQAVMVVWIELEGGVRWWAGRGKESWFLGWGMCGGRRAGGGERLKVRLICFNSKNNH